MPATPSGALHVCAQPTAPWPPAAAAPHLDRRPAHAQRLSQQLVGREDKVPRICPPVTHVGRQAVAPQHQVVALQAGGSAWRSRGIARAAGGSARGAQRVCMGRQQRSCQRQVWPVAAAPRRGCSSPAGPGRCCPGHAAPPAAAGRSVQVGRREAGGGMVWAGATALGCMSSRAPSGMHAWRRPLPAPPAAALAPSQAPHLGRTPLQKRAAGAAAGAAAGGGGGGGSEQLQYPSIPAFSAPSRISRRQDQRSAPVTSTHQRSRSEQRATQRRPTALP